MSDHTRYEKYQVDLFFQNADSNIEQLIDNVNYSDHSTFLNHYVTHFPTLGDYVYQYIFHTTDLEKHYSDYTLSQPLDDGDREVEAKRKTWVSGEDFYIRYYHAYIRDKAYALAEAGGGQDLKKFLNHFSSKMDRQGYVYQRSAKESVTVRNVAFHLAFALEMDVVTLKDILLKCLLQQVFNPKNHKECIYWYCLNHGISYSEMYNEYLSYYDSDDFDKKYENALEKGIVHTPTWVLEADIQQMLDNDREAFFRYLWRLKYTEKQIQNKEKTEFGKVALESALKRNTLADVYWENICYFVDEEDPTTVQSPLTEEQYAQRFPEIWKSLRKKCYESNKDPLMDRKTLNVLFAEIDYSKRGIENRKWNQVDMPRTEIIATQFIARCSRGPAKNMPRSVMRKDFEKEVNADLMASGLRKIYLRSPFELFVILCFLHENPFEYFMASWEYAVTQA